MVALKQWKLMGREIVSRWRLKSLTFLKAWKRKATAKLFHWWRGKTVIASASRPEIGGSNPAKVVGIFAILMYVLCGFEEKTNKYLFK
jgi:hypothetical protein